LVLLLQQSDELLATAPAPLQLDGGELDDELVGEDELSDEDGLSDELFD
jgi:hypothetical protein